MTTVHLTETGTYIFTYVTWDEDGHEIEVSKVEYKPDTEESN